MKIGIVTHYWNSTNYGGNLQAYALVEAINKIPNCEAEQICLNFQNELVDLTKVLTFSKNKSISMLTNYTFKQLIEKILLKVVRKNKYINKKYQNNFKIRKASFEYFNKQIIKHSNNVFNRKTIAKANDYYDAFVTGSDQVWNFLWFYEPFFLNFVKNEKYKISYAASISMEKINEVQKTLFKDFLYNFNAISVRELSDKKLIDKLTSLTIQNTMDPTMLLNKEDWDKICLDKIYSNKYLFCYFLGNDKNNRKLAKKFAKKHKLKIVNIAHMNGFKLVDVNFGDYNVYDAGPEKFLSLIKFAEYIFTDSFHALVFSHIYEKNYFVFKRCINDTMTTRITNILNIFETQDRFCDTPNKNHIEYIEKLKIIDYNKLLNKFEKLKKLSFKFLKDNLGN